MESLRWKFGQRLKHIRKKEGMTQAELAEMSDVCVDFISLVERGINAPSFDTIERLSASLNVTAQDLFNFNSEICE